jgi:hypothetical protein
MTKDRFQSHLAQIAKIREQGTFDLTLTFGGEELTNLLRYWDSELRVAYVNDKSESTNWDEFKVEQIALVAMLIGFTWRWEAKAKHWVPPTKETMQKIYMLYWLKQKIERIENERRAKND